jgi:PAS domain S-box-containing protein
MLESEIKYQLLFDAIDEGFCIIEVIFDEYEKPVDYRFLEVNPSFAKQTGLINVQGRSMREIAPEHEEYWFEIYGKVALTGQPVRFENSAGQLHRWYDVYAFRVGQTEDRQVAILFNDISERKKTEELYRTVISSAPISIFATDKNGIFILHEGKALENAGMEEGENVGVSAYDLFSDLNVIENNGNLINGKSVLDRVLNGESLSGITELNGVWFDNRFTPILDLKNQVSGMIGVATNISGHKKAEEALKEKEGLYRLLFENSGEAILMTNPDGSIYSANPEACRIFGMSEDEICKLGRDGIVDLNDPRLGPAIYARKQTNKFKGELNLIRKDGTTFPAEVSSTLFSDSSGNERTAMIIRDISERVTAEISHQESEAAFRSIFENSIMGISQAYPGGKFIRINQAYAEMYGYPDPSTMLNEVTDNTIKLFANSSDREKVLAILDKKGYMAPTEFELKRRNGVNFWALVSAKQVRDDSGKFLYLQAEHIDITSQKKLEEERYLASFYARNLIEASLDPLVTINIEGKITDVNLATEKITGLKRKKLIGSDFSDYFTEAVRAREGYRTVFRKGRVTNYPLTILHKSGKKTPVLYNATLFKNEAGDVQGVFAAARDITERKKMEEELRRSGELLEKLNLHLHKVWENEKSQIALNLHDDLGQKLTALDLDVAWIRGRIGVQTSSVNKKLAEMRLMINEIVESTKEISSFLRPAILFDLGLFPAISSLLDKFEKTSGIICNFQSGTEEINIDDGISLIIYRVLQEALTNIARHSGATIAEITISLSENRIDMVIQDNGKGIEDEKVNSITSMGITGIKERVHSVQGNVKIKGGKEFGTRIMVSIPLNKFDDDKSTDYR